MGRQGTITLSEMKTALESLNVQDEQVKQIFSALDTAADQEIHYSEFLAAMVSTRIRLHDELLRSTFERLDCDHSGYITPQNLRDVLGDDFSGARMEDLIKEADFLDDGRISYDEFITFLERTSTRTCSWAQGRRATVRDTDAAIARAKEFSEGEGGADLELRKDPRMRDRFRSNTRCNDAAALCHCICSPWNRCRSPWKSSRGTTTAGIRMHGQG